MGKQWYFSGVKGAGKFYLPLSSRYFGIIFGPEGVKVVKFRHEGGGRIARSWTEKVWKTRVRTQIYVRHKLPQNANTFSMLKK